MFKRGDRVVCIKEYYIDKGLIGEIGTVYTNCKTQDGKCWHFRYHPEQYLIKIDCIEIL